MHLVEGQMSTHIYQQMVDWMTTMTAHRSGKQWQDHWGMRNGYTHLHVKFFDNDLSSTFMWNTPTQSSRDISH